MIPLSHTQKIGWLSYQLVNHFFYLLQASKKALIPVAPIYKYGLISISNILTTTCQYEVSVYAYLVIKFMYVFSVLRKTELSYNDSKSLHRL